MYTITQAGEAQLLLNMVNADLTLRLFVNDVMPGRGTVTSALKEPTGSGYRPVALTPGRWKVIPGDPGRVQYPPQDFVFQASVGRIYGYFVTQGPTLLYAVRLPEDAPFYAKWKGDTLVVQPILRNGMRL